MSDVSTTHLSPAVSPTRRGSATDGPVARAEDPTDAMLNKRELAARLKVTVRTIENWQKRGVLPFMKVGKVVLFDWSDVVEHLKANFRVCRRSAITH